MRCILLAALATALAACGSGTTSLPTGSGDEVIVPVDGGSGGGGGGSGGGGPGPGPVPGPVPGPIPNPGPAPVYLEGGVVATFAVDGDVFSVWVTSEEGIDQLLDLWEGAIEGVPDGFVVEGGGQDEHNDPWTWHLDNEDFRIVDPAEASDDCDGLPSDVEDDLDGYLAVERYCPQDAEIIDLVDWR